MNIFGMNSILPRICDTCVVIHLMWFILNSHNMTIIINIEAYTFQKPRHQIDSLETKVSGINSKFNARIISLLLSFCFANLTVNAINRRTKLNIDPSNDEIWFIVKFEQRDKSTFLTFELFRGHT